MIVGARRRSRATAPVAQWRSSRGWASNPQTAFATRTPEGAHEHTGVIERVIEMGGNSPEVDAANAGNWGLRVEGSGTWKRRDNLERLFEFLGERVVVVAIG
jgi:hypothetical protein